MKKKFESLSSFKFTPLKHKTMAHVLGGRATGAGREPSGMFEEKEVPNPDAPGQTMTMRRAIYNTWTTDEVDGDVTCRYGLGVGYGEWR